MTKKILVVDDEEHIVKVVKDRLEANGYSVVTAFDGDEALVKYQSENPDLIVLDLMLPKLDGFSVARRIREQEASQGKKRLPIIMLTARTSKEDGSAGYAAGGDVYVKKPFDAAKLEELVKQCLSKE